MDFITNIIEIEIEILIEIELNIWKKKKKSTWPQNQFLQCRVEFKIV